MSPPREQKNALEPKHRGKGSISYRLQSASPDTDTLLLAIHSVRVSKGLYGPNLLFDFELAKDLSNHFTLQCIFFQLPTELLVSKDTLIAKKTQTVILRSRALRDIVIKPGDVWQVYVKLDKYKSCKVLISRKALTVELLAGTVTVIKSLLLLKIFEKQSLTNTFASSIMEIINTINSAIDICLNTSTAEDQSMIAESSRSSSDEIQTGINKWSPVCLLVIVLKYFDHSTINSILVLFLQ